MLENYPDILLNLILVKEEVRPSFMIQYVDYGENNISEPITLSILNEIKKIFPEFIHSYDYQGIIISKYYEGNKNLYSLSNLKDDELGKIIGYPCYAEFEETLNNKENKTIYSFTIYASLLNNQKYDILANISLDLKKYEEFENISKKSFLAFVKNNDFLDKYNISIKEVNVNIQKWVSIDTLINKLYENTKLDDYDYAKINNIFYNMCFSDNYYQILMNFDENNQIHRGILIGILLTEKNDRLKPFYPLIEYPNQLKEIEIISKKIENDILNIFRKK